MFPNPRCVEKNIWTVAKYHTCNVGIKCYDLVVIHEFQFNLGQKLSKMA
jgi:hypothetical protein